MAGHGCQIVVPGNPLVFHFRSAGLLLVALPKLLEGCDRALLSHGSRQALKDYHPAYLEATA